MMNTNNSSTYRLMIKEHLNTGLKYLCITKRKNWRDYLGSGVYWRKHLLKHGPHIKTTLLYESKDYDDFVEVCSYYSEVLKPHEVREFANQVPELGYENGRIGKSNLELWWIYASEKTKQETLKKRNASIQKAWSEFSPEFKKQIYEKISKKNSDYWKNFTLEERRQLTEDLRSRAKKYWAELTDDRRKEVSELKSKNANNFYRNVSPKWKEDHGKKVSIGRLNMSPEKKIARAERIRDSFATSEKRKEYVKKMSKERIGGGNPNARKIEIEGIIYDSISGAAKKLNLKRHVVVNRLNSNNEKWKNWKKI